MEHFQGCERLTRYPQARRGAALSDISGVIGKGSVRHSTIKVPLAASIAAKVITSERTGGRILREVGGLAFEPMRA